MRQADFDLLIVGSGIAGLRAAIAVAGAGRRAALLTKDGATDSSSDKAQGGIAAVLSEDDELALHYEDTLAAGDGLCNEAAVRVLVEEGPARALELIEWGARFDREGTRLALAREAAHSKRRILRAQGDSTGREIVRALVEKARTMEGVTLLPRTFSIDLVLQGGRIAGLLALDEGNERVALLRAPAVLLATGGAGMIYRETTNPPQATGDGAAMAYRAGAEMMDLEFVQFHPTALMVSGAPRFLLSEAMRGEGGRLVDSRMRPFMTEFDPRGDLAPRDIVARGIFEVMRRTGAASVFLDMSGLPADAVRARFPRIASTCAAYGLDIGRDPLPVAPCAHFMMGGVKTDLMGRTAIPGLYAAGEVACTGVHGANRLASNSLLEGLVFGARAGAAVVHDRILEGTGGVLPAPAAGDDAAARLGDAVRSIDAAAAGEIVARLREVMWTDVGLVRDAEGLRRAVGEILNLESGLAPRTPRRAGLEARNLLFVGRLVAESARRREESRGSHWRSDFPRPEPGRGRHAVIAPGAPAPDLPMLERGITASL
ncbi:MAG TPA: L-aspartate oxidase [Candidatus Polarisedimenticolia bacterium]|nr:L-aspartate oxidase [Candidatus Polarisedimenticolia bacterium]